MKIIKEMPENAEEGSKWLVMRQNGEVTFSTVSNTYFYEGDASSGADVLDVISDGEGNVNRVAYYMPLTEEIEKEAPSVGSDLKLNDIVLGPHAIANVMYNLTRIFDTARTMANIKNPEQRRRCVDEIEWYIGGIKTELLEKK